MSSINYKPLSDRVIIEPETAEEVTRSGIVIPDSAKEKPQTGKVLSVINLASDTLILTKSPT